MTRSRHSSGPERRPPAGPAAPARSARDAACRRLAEEAARYPDLALHPLDDRGLDDREAALAHALYDACVRRWITLEHLLGPCLDRPIGRLEPAVRAALLCGAAQLVLLGGVPDHAAIHESVEWAKRSVRPGAGALVNAVLRRLAARRGPKTGGRPGEDAAPAPWAGQRDAVPLSGGGVVRFAEPVLPEDPIERLGVAGGVPAWLAARWASVFGPPEAQRLVLHSLAHAPVILNTEAADASAPPPDGLSPHEEPGHHVFRGTRAELVALLASRPDVWVQDPAAAAAVRSVRGLRPALVIDLCAGMGTKTRQLAAAFPGASVVAADSDADHVRALALAFQGHDRVTALPLPLVQARCRGRADLVLLDVPCSNTGVLARRVEARHRANAATLARLAALQARIVDEAVPLLAPRGAILYSTCSLEHEENAAQAESAAAGHGLRVSAPALRLPRGGPGLAPAEYADGSFSCVIARAAES